MTKLFTASLLTCLFFSTSFVSAQSMSQEVNHEARKVDKEVKAAIGDTKSVVNEELCNSGQQECTYKENKTIKTKAGKKTVKKTIKKVETEQ